MQQDRIRLVEHFLSIQGESTHAGRLCYFIRLAGCNLNCQYCDTQYARSPEAGEFVSLDHLVELVKLTQVRLVEITGGEPLLQHGTPELCRRFLAENFEVLVETNGSLPICSLPPEAKKILDCKTPSSGMSEYNLYDNYQIISPRDEVKFVIADRRDYDFARRVIEEYDLPLKTERLLFSPVWGRIEPETLAGWMIADTVPARFQLQLHKIIWGPDKTGV
jgi:7-carboxy-7-deazaguanine synthase